ncbi:MAG: DUF1667 domain-containing protein [Firmicutes bacterium]|jgi:CxxC motif-containing protein|nr:DUF1667 domain-containing protein [Bacillota bacterium]
MSKKEIICIVCPVGCKLLVEENREAEGGYTVEGHTCKRGIKYGIEEMRDPRRNICSTVPITGAALGLLPVRTNHPIPKDMIFDCMKEINKVRVTAPVKVGDVIIKNVLGTGTDIVASRSMAEAG